ncbi:homing endonuclease [Vibrio phage D479]
MNCYVYRITNVVSNRHYYGYRKSSTNHPNDDLGVVYFSSSSDKTFIAEQRDFPTHFRYKIIAWGLTQERALILEEKLQRRFQVDVNPAFYNRRIMNDRFHCNKETGRKIAANKSRARKISKTHKQLFANGKRTNSGKSNPRYGDHRTYDEIHGVGKSTSLKLSMSQSRTGAGNANAKRWIAIDPNGNEYCIRGNVKQFCTNHGLCIRALKTNLGKPYLSNHTRTDKGRNTIGWMLIKLQQYQ